MASKECTIKDTHASIKWLVKISIIYHTSLVVCSALVNILFEDFDSSTWTTEGEAQASRSASITSLVVKFAINGLTKWDSVYFNHIAGNYGYEYEQMLAFAPGFPYLVHWIQSCLEFIIGANNVNSKAVGIALNLIFNIIATVLIYKLTLKISNVKSKVKDRYAVVASLAFIFNPANIFMISNYSESMFVAVQFALLWLLENESFFLASLMVSISTLVRSNGLLNVVFLVYFYIKRIITKEQIFEKYQCKHSLVECLKPSILYLLIKSFYKHLFIILVYTTLSLTPYLTWQYHVYKRFCEITHVVRSHNTHWCTYTLPFSYSYIQSHYWNVGFLKYFTLSQIPNFLLAAPICTIIFSGVYQVYTQNKHSKTDVLPWLGLKEVRFHLKNEDVTMLPADRTFVYMCHAFFLTVFGILNVHVQILTRMICSSTPFVYWSVAELVTNQTLDKSFKRRVFCIVLGYFITYNILGLFLHTNFYPWT
ncbi:GPI mannosyltransferase 2-like [Clytia hemisphaerica]|uniref:GPI mannosyltransferase 2-like n=1 Tax=Clytia hemisphaerica TaxID=252671 RepID=UPI0034D759E7|eukprot:TCONS_00051715-protein